MHEDQNELEKLRELIKQASSREALDSFFKTWRREILEPLKKQISSSSCKEEKKKLGLQFKTLSSNAQELYDNRKIELSAWAHPFYSAREHTVRQSQKINYKSDNLLGTLKSEVFDFLKIFNFKFYEESEIVKTNTNFDSLLIPPGHPARESSDSFFLDYLGQKQKKDTMMLRTHTTTSTLSLLQKNKRVIFKGASLGSVYRKEDNNSTHLSQFTQLDLVWVDYRLSLENLRKLVEDLLSFLFKGEERHYRLRASYFPFTSPSYEVDLSCTCKSLKNCKLCKGAGWIEILGCGFLRSEILDKTHLGKVAIAAGLGLERIAMVKFQISDIRDLYKNNLTTLAKKI